MNKYVIFPYLLIPKRQASTSFYISNRCRHYFIKYPVIRKSGHYLWLPNTNCTIICVFQRNKIVKILAGINIINTISFTLPEYDALYILRITADQMISYPLHLNGSQSQTSLSDAGTVFPGLKRFLSEEQDLLHFEEPNRLIYHFEKNIFLSSNPLSGKKEYIVNRIFQFAKANSYNAKVTDIATHLGYTERQIQKIFHDLTGRSIKSYCQTERLYRACDMLCSGDAQIQDISFFLGYYDQSHFNHFFRKIAGCTPLEYQHLVFSLSSGQPSRELRQYFPEQK